MQVVQIYDVETDQVRPATQKELDALLTKIERQRIAIASQQAQIAHLRTLLAAAWQMMMIYRKTSGVGDDADYSELAQKIKVALQFGTIMDIDSDVAD